MSCARRWLDALVRGRPALRRWLLDYRTKAKPSARGFRLCKVRKPTWAILLEDALPDLTYELLRGLHGSLDYRRGDIVEGCLLHIPVARRLRAWLAVHEGISSLFYTSEQRVKRRSVLV